jgi:hypothetical protein
VTEGNPKDDFVADSGTSWILLGPHAQAATGVIIGEANPKFSLDEARIVPAPNTQLPELVMSLVGAKLITYVDQAKLLPQN